MAALKNSQKRNSSKVKVEQQNTTPSTSSTGNGRNSMTTNITYNATGNGAMRRIRTPATHDVLSGRGGSVNAHPGNTQFRAWVATRKTEYNFASNKLDKAKICQQVIDQVKELGGRFLVKESPSSSWWVELDEERILSKTSQALREGAPKIREAHKDEFPEARGGGRRGRRGSGSSGSKRRRGGSSSRHATTTTTTTSASAHGQQQQPAQTATANNNNNNNNKRVRVLFQGQAVLPHEDTPPLAALPAPTPARDRMMKDDHVLMPAPETPFPTGVPNPLSRRLSEQKNSNNGMSGGSNHSGISRTHSLALSDMSLSPDDLVGEFVNPFEDESDIFGTTPRLGGGFSSNLRSFAAANNSSTTRNPTTSTVVIGSSSTLLPTSSTTPPPRPGVLRESSATSLSSDMGGLGALLRPSADSASSNHNNKSESNNNKKNNTTSNNANNMNSGVRSTLLKSSHSSSSNLSNRYAVSSSQSAATDENNNDDLASVGSQITVGLPMWEWFIDSDLAAGNSIIPVSP